MKAAMDSGNALDQSAPRRDANKTSKFRPNIEKSDYCFAGGLRDIIAASNDAGAGTVVANFDAYGERLPDTARSLIEVAKSRSMALSRIGQVVFWAVAIVSAGSPVLLLGGPTV